MKDFDRTAIMTAGGAFLGAAIVQLLGGGPTQLLGAFLGAILGLLSSLYVSR
jgi:outer membrane lipoprotein SlyB